MINEALKNLRLDLESSIDEILNTKTSTDSLLVLKNNLKHWNNQYLEILESEKELLKTIVLLEANSCIRATLVSLSGLDTENKNLYKEALSLVGDITALLRQKEIDKINKITELLHFN